VPPQICCQDIDDRAAVSLRVSRDPGQSIDTAETNIELVAAQLIDCPREPICDLSLLREIDASLRELQGLAIHSYGLVGEHETSDEDCASQDLNARHSDVVAGFQQVGRAETHIAAGDEGVRKGDEKYAKHNGSEACQEPDASGTNNFMCYEESTDEKRREGDHPARSRPLGALDKGTYPLTDCSEVHGSRR
jgi:hypothetical protein